MPQIKKGRFGPQGKVVFPILRPLPTDFNPWAALAAWGWRSRLKQALMLAYSFEMPGAVVRLLIKVLDLREA
jgi:hypothetical protein